MKDKRVQTVVVQALRDRADSIRADESIRVKIGLDGAEYRDYFARQLVNLAYDIERLLK